ncbi:MAG: carboxypeptidase, partial [Anaerolineae bacterium]|nr:carboxypeptidase [Anaerolineae bacterium]
LHMWTNVPPEFLEKEISPFPEWIVWHALISPKLALRETSVTSLGGDSFRVRLVIQNEGWLPTYVTKKALERKVTRGVIAEIQLPKGASLESGKQREELGELNGRSYKNAFIDELGEGTDDRVKVEWVVKAKKGTKVKLIAKHDRAGVVKVDVVLK